MRFVQEEVDNLTKRAKLSESAFLSIFQPLYDAPDPVAALVTATRVADIEAENQKLQVGGPTPVCFASAPSPRVLLTCRVLWVCVCVRVLLNDLTRRRSWTSSGRRHPR
jgi:hypothetical protein